MKRGYVALLSLVILPLSLYGQSGSINNTLGSGGTFNIKDGSTTFFSISQSTGYVSLTNSLTLPATTGLTLGVIYKGANRFIHDYQAAGTQGYNTFVGINSGNFTISGTGDQASYNTALGNSSLSSLTIGKYNSAFGYNSLNANTTAGDNSAFGHNSLTSNTTGGLNSAFGYNSLTSNTTLGGNSAFGGNSLTSNTGSSNSAFGSNSLTANTTAGGNSAFGGNSLVANTIGSGNSAFGYHSLVANTIGNGNSAFGGNSLSQNTTGTNNSAFGYNAGANLTTGGANTVIGYNAQASSPTVGNEVTLGDGSINTLRCNVQSISSLSDARDKKNIRDLPLGLDFLMKVRPRQFNWDRRGWYENGKPDGSKIQENPTAGFIAQELDDVQTKEGAGWLNLVLKSNPDRLEATPGNLLPIMVKAIQELKAENGALKAEVVNLRASIAEEVKKEVRTVLLKAVQQEVAKTKVSLNQTKD
jgi:hypothetical protein